MNDFDAVVIGGGPAGSATATLLARQGHRVALCDRAAFPRAKPCAEYISPEARRVLDDLLPPEALAGHAESLGGMRVISPAGMAFEGRFAAGHGFRGYSWTGLAVPRTILDTALLEAAARAGVTVMERTTLASVGSVRNGRRDLVLVQPGRRTTVSGRLIVGADGLHSTVARQLGLARRGGRRRVALVTHARGVAGMKDMGEMHVWSEGYVGLARVGRDLTNVSVVVDTKRFRPGGNRRGWLDRALAMVPEVASRLARAEYVTPILGAGPFGRWTTRATDDRAVLVGDAADFWDPFTGEGIYSALVGAELVASVAGSRLADDDLSRRALRAYDRSRRQAFRGKWLVERLIARVIASPRALDHVARRLRARPDLADLLVGVTGDIVPPSEVLRPAFARQLVW